jgi:hypothetical protein
VRVIEGDRVKSRLTGTVYEVKRLRDISVILESEDGSNQEWTDNGNLKLFFEKLENRDA